MKKLLLLLFVVAAGFASAQTDSTPASNVPAAAPADSDAASAIPVLQIDAGKVTGQVSPTLYGLMTEEINYSYEGGLYGELIRNRSFMANPLWPIYWDVIGNPSVALDKNQPLNSALDVSLKVDASTASEKAPEGIANRGYWGIPVRPDTTYRASFFAKSDNFRGPLTVALVSINGETIFASAKVPSISSDWQQYTVTLKTKDVQPSKDNVLEIYTTTPGTIWFQQVSLFPPTFDNQSNSFRPDIMKLLAAMRPKFLRFPGGNYLEGNTISERFNWKKTIGPTQDRPGHKSPWGYWSNDGIGLLEFLDWCQDLHMQPVLAVYAGYSLDGQHIAPGPELETYVRSALEEIEYVTGETNTKWGAQRAKDGHPAPFPLHYVEIGNEDYNRSSDYNGRFAQFYDAIKAKYPNLKVIATAPVTSRTPDLLDEHFYRSQEDMEANAFQYDKHPRTGPKIFVGEWATRVGSPTPDMAGALGDAAWMTGLERNSDLVVMASYAPLFVNVSQLQGQDRSMQWTTDLIGYNALTSYGSPSYYAQVMFSTMHGNEILATRSENIPTREWPPPGFRGRTPPPRRIRQIFFDATRDSQSGIIYLKVVNEASNAQPVKIRITGAPRIEPEGEAVVLQANGPNDTNSIEHPRNIVPRAEAVHGLSVNFTREFPPYSITVLKLGTR
jgi:alpha-L-arabinofuranosidase